MLCAGKKKRRVWMDSERLMVLDIWRAKGQFMCGTIKHLQRHWHAARGCGREIGTHPGGRTKKKSQYRPRGLNSFIKK
eukprot:285723-Rhodomonas_salina.1